MEPFAFGGRIAPNYCRLRAVIFLKYMIQRLEKFANRGFGMMLLLSLPIFLALLPELAGVTKIISTAYQPTWFSYFTFYQDSIRSHQNFLWDPYIFSGFPLFVTVTGGFLTPILFVALRFFSVPTVYYYFIFFDMVLAAWLTSHIAKKLEMSVPAQFIAGVTYAFSCWQFTINIVDANSFWILPLCVLVLLKVDEKRWFLWSILGGIGIAWGWLAAHWHRQVLIIFAVGIFSLFLVWARTHKGWRQALRPAYAGAIMICFGTFIGLLQIVPTLVYIPQSIQLGAGYTHAEAIKAGVDWLSIPTLFLPFLDHPLFSIGVLYIAILPIALFIFGIELRPRKAKEISGLLSWFFVFMVILSLERSPLFWLFHHIPPINLIHGPQRSIYMAFFALALLAGFGLDRAKEFIHKIHFRLIQNTMKWIMVIIGVTAVMDSLLIYVWREKLLFLTNAYFDEYVYKASMRHPVEYYHAYIATMIQKALHLFDPLNLQFVVPFFFIVATYTFLRWFYLHEHNPNYKWIAAAIIAFNFALVFLTLGIDTRISMLPPKPAIVHFIESQEGSHTFLTFLGTPALFEKFIVPYGDGVHSSEELLRFVSELMLPDIDTKYQVSNAEFLEPLASRSMENLLVYLGSPATYQLNQVSTTTLLSASLPTEKKVVLFSERLPIADLIGIRYVVSAYSLESIAMPKVFETKATEYQIPIFVYENKDARPLFYTTSERDLLDMSSSTTPELLEGKITALKKNSMISQEGITLIEKFNDRIALRIVKDRESLLVFSQNNLPGWTVSIDGVRAPLHTFATVYQSAVVPAGMHLVRFEFHYWEIWRAFLKTIKQNYIWNS